MRSADTIESTRWIRRFDVMMPKVLRAWYARIRSSSSSPSFHRFRRQHNPGREQKVVLMIATEERWVPFFFVPPPASRVPMPARTHFRPSRGELLPGTDGTATLPISARSFPRSAGSTTSSPARSYRSSVPIWLCRLCGASLAPGSVHFEVELRLSRILLLFGGHSCV